MTGVVKWFEDEKGYGYIEEKKDKVLIYVVSNGKIIDVEIKTS